ncbi:MAG: hypothetical protein VKI81_01425 [Synechococcaceae cyanobacterium]|nr:hypothetical protein [Synechococcaceae cyanobacterium]
MELGTVLEDLQDRVRPLRARLFPQLVLLELHDSSLRGQVLRDGLDPQPVSIEAPLPPLTCRNGRPLEKEPLGDLIGDLLVRDGLIEALVMAALPPAAMEWRVLEWPGEDLLGDPIQALRGMHDPPLRLPFPLEEASVDVHPLPGSPPRMLFAATPRALVEDWIQVFNLAGVRLERLAPAQACRLAALQGVLDKVSDDELVIVVDPGEADRWLLLIHRSVPVFERELPGDDDALVAEVARCVAFYRRHDPSSPDRLRLVLGGPFARRDALEHQLGTAAEELAAEPFGSLVLQGLATQEVQP